MLILSQSDASCLSERRETTKPMNVGGAFLCSDRPPCTQTGYLDELSHHSGALGGTGSGQSGDTFGDGAVGLFVRQSGTLGVNWTRQHSQQVHVTQTRSVCGHQSLHTHEICFISPLFKLSH